MPARRRCRRSRRSCGPSSTGSRPLVGYWDTGLRNRLANDAYCEWFGFAPQAASRHACPGRARRTRSSRRTGRTSRGRSPESAQQFDRTLVDAAGESRFTEVTYTPDTQRRRGAGLLRRGHGHHRAGAGRPAPATGHGPVPRPGAKRPRRLRAPLRRRAALPDRRRPGAGDLRLPQGRARRPAHPGRAQGRSRQRARAALPRGPRRPRGLLEPADRPPHLPAERRAGLLRRRGRGRHGGGR